MSDSTREYMKYRWDWDYIMALYELSGLQRWARTILISNLHKIVNGLQLLRLLVCQKVLTV